MNQESATSRSVVQQFFSFLERTMGLEIRDSERKFFDEHFLKIMKEFGFSDALSCMVWLMEPPFTEHKLQVLARHLTVAETYFFRDLKTFQALEETILPAIMEKKKLLNHSLRFWSVACSTGEEPYSLSILLKQLIPDSSEWKISILATDINDDYLQIAKKGRYKEWSFRTTPEPIKNQFFTQNKKEYVLNPSLKQPVDFRFLNLAEDNYPSFLTGTDRMDLILCMNVLIYFSDSVARKIVERLKDALLPGGWLIVSAIEAPYVTEASFTHFSSDKIMAFMKKEGAL